MPGSFDILGKVIKNDNSNFITIQEVIVNNTNFITNLNSSQPVLNWVYENNENKPVIFPFYLLKSIEQYYTRLGVSAIVQAINILCIKAYAHSVNYNSGDARFTEYIAPRIENKKFELEDIKNLIKSSNDNDQACGRGRSYNDHEQVGKYIQEQLKIHDKEQLKILQDSFFKNAFSEVNITENIN